MNALSDFVQTWYLELMCLLPAVLMLAGLTWAVIMDSYIQKNRKRTMLILCALVFSLIAQNYAENLLSLGEPRVMLRTIVAAYGYIVRPMILLLFLKILHPEKSISRNGAWRASTPFYMPCPFLRRSASRLMKTTPLAAVYFPLDKPAQLSA